MESEKNNVYASNLKNEPIHISEAESGRKGYYCLGCKKEMQAMKSKSFNRISFFRHDPKAVRGLPKCNYSDETFTHWYAKEVLFNSKRVKVPALYKYPPRNSTGFPNLLAEERFIEAYFVGKEFYFYETGTGEIIWSKSTPKVETFLLVEPDIVFFDENMQPRLFIEIVVTHKLSEKKLLDLKRLGIDTIQITIHQETKPDIEKAIETTNHTKWIYNNEQERTEYISIPESNSKGIPPIDELQRDFFEESFKCRAAEINNLIRTIKRCLESEQYRTIAGNLESEISRVKNNTEGVSESIDQLRTRVNKRIAIFRNDIRIRITEKYRGRGERIEIEKGEIDKEEGRIESEAIERYRGVKDPIEAKYRDLETRYNIKRNEIEGKTVTIDGEIYRIENEIGDIENQSEQERRAIYNEEESIGKITAEERSVDSETKRIDRDTRFELEYSEGKTATGINNEREEEEFGREIQERFGEDRRRIEAEFQILRNEFTQAVETRTYSGNGYTKEFKGLLVDLEFANDFVHKFRIIKRYKWACECFEKKSFKNWHD